MRTIQRKEQELVVDQLKKSGYTEDQIVDAVLLKAIEKNPVASIPKIFKIASDTNGQDVQEVADIINQHFHQNTLVRQLVNAQLKKRQLI